MASNDLIRYTGKIIDVLPASTFSILIEGKNSTSWTVLGYLSGKMKQNKIMVVLGDTVDVEVSPYDSTKGRITSRKDRR